LLLLLMGAVCWWLGDNAAHNYRWQWYRVWRYIGAAGDGGFVPGPLLAGLRITLQLTGISLVLALGLGALLSLMRLSPSPVARLAAGLALGAIRNTPLLMQLFMFYFVAAPVFGVGPFWAAALVLAAFEGSYVAEIFRAGVISLPRSQWEAALSLGFSLPLAARLVILPQALRNVLAPLASQIISLIKDTSLVSAIAVADLTMRARVIITDTFLSFEIWLLTAAIYLVLTLLVGIPARWLERHPL
jgi:polar amino acid transport system permease protein